MSQTRIMIVEDEPAVARDMQDCLLMGGYGVTSIVGTGEKAIQLAEEERPDLVLMDIHLRGALDGIDTADEIHSGFGIPVVFLTAHADPELLERAEKVGPFGYLVKPFEERELQATIKMALYKSKADSAIRAASRMEATATLAGGIAHDYNNLMTVVLGAANLVREDLGDAHPNAAMLKEIESAARKASELAQRLLAFARGGAYQMEEVDLNGVVRETLQVQERMLHSGIEMKCVLDGKLWQTTADRAHLAMLLADLCVNAAEAIEEHGTIAVTTRNAHVDLELAKKNTGMKPGRYAVLSVEDNGRGMSADVLARAFEPFFSTKFQGRGLGLASVYGIVKNHGGYIATESEKNKGTTCTVYLPAADVAASEPVLKPPTTTKGTETILVVDDEMPVLTLVAKVLKRLGYQVLTAHGGRAAVDLVREYEMDIHLALLDMGMPEMDGPTAFPQLITARPDLKVLLFSGYELDTTAQALLDAGANGFLKKPVTPKTLGEEVRRVLDR